MSERVTPLFADKQPGPEDEQVDRTFLDVARAVSAICATRMLLLIAVITGAAVWGWTVYDPQRERLYAAIAYSLVFVLPQTVLYWRKG